MLTVSSGREGIRPSAVQLARGRALWRAKSKCGLCCRVDGRHRLNGLDHAIGRSANSRRDCIVSARRQKVTRPARAARGANTLVGNKRDAHADRVRTLSRARSRFLIELAAGDSEIYRRHTVSFGGLVVRGDSGEQRGLGSGGGSSQAWRRRARGRISRRSAGERDDEVGEQRCGHRHCATGGFPVTFRRGDVAAHWDERCSHGYKAGRQVERA